MPTSFLICINKTPAVINCQCLSIHHFQATASAADPFNFDTTVCKNGKSENILLDPSWMAGWLTGWLAGWAGWLAWLAGLTFHGFA